jgi:hypothetical protein
MDQRKTVPPLRLRQSILNALFVVQPAPQPMIPPIPMLAYRRETVTWVGLNHSDTTANMLIGGFKRINIIKDEHGHPLEERVVDSPFEFSETPTRGALSGESITISATVKNNAVPGRYHYEISINGAPIVDPELEIEP